MRGDISKCLNPDVRVVQWLILSTLNSLLCNPGQVLPVLSIFVNIKEPNTYKVCSKEPGTYQAPKRASVFLRSVFRLVSSYSNCFRHKSDSLIVYLLAKKTPYISFTWSQSYWSSFCLLNPDIWGTLYLRRGYFYYQLGNLLLLKYIEWIYAFKIILHTCPKTNVNHQLKSASFLVTSPACLKSWSSQHAYRPDPEALPAADTY